MRFLNQSFMNWSHLNKRISRLDRTILLLVCANFCLRSETSVLIFRCFLRILTSFGLICMRICSVQSSENNSRFSGFICLKWQKKKNMDESNRYKLICKLTLLNFHIIDHWLEPKHHQPHRVTFPESMDVWPSIFDLCDRFVSAAP